MSVDPSCPFGLLQSYAYAGARLVPWFVGLGTVFRGGGWLMSKLGLNIGLGRLANSVSQKFLSYIPFRSATTQANRATSFAGSKSLQLQYAPHQKVRNAPATICGQRYSGHALDKMQDRGIMPSVVRNVIKSGVESANKYANRTQFYDAAKQYYSCCRKQIVVTVTYGRL